MGNGRFIMMDMRNFVISTPETENETFLAEQGAIILRDEQGREWYSSQALFSAETVKVMYDSDNIVRAITMDVSTLYPHMHSVAEIVDLPDGADIHGDWVYSDGEVVARKYSSDELVAAANDQKSHLREIADSEIAWRQDAVDAGIATDEETAALTEWKKYRVLLMRVDTAKPVWPTLPTA
ncbi:tail fiber assembly protein [Salmonella enterica subsp. houtenae str. CFSAN000557]|nr:tail fiber assembly protein [Salmonella enterica subsp. houtenae str. CFSAN000557]